VGITADDFASMVPMGRIDRQKKLLKQLFSRSDAASHWTQPSDRRIYSELIETINYFVNYFRSVL